MQMGMTGVRAGLNAVLTNHVRGYSNANFIGRSLFPIAQMPARLAQRIEFDKRSFVRWNTQRAPGADYKFIDFGFSGQAVRLRQNALAAKVPQEYVEEAAAQPGIDLQMDAADVVMEAILLEHEIQSAAIARNAASYAASNKLALAGATKWNVATGKPLQDIESGKEAIRKTIGRKPNTLVLPGAVASALRTHPDMIGRFVYKDASPAYVSDEMLRAAFDVEMLLIGNAIFSASETAPLQDVWGGDAILAYVGPASTGKRRNIAVPSYGYTYNLAGYPIVDNSKWDDKSDSWINKVKDEWSVELVGADAGYLIQAAI
jgi:hypothetical protein